MLINALLELQRKIEKEKASRGLQVASMLRREPAAAGSGNGA
jgi:hypothetical protein